MLKVKTEGSSAGSMQGKQAECVGYNSTFMRVINQATVLCRTKLLIAAAVRPVNSAE
jgi:hypothetical protein